MVRLLMVLLYGPCKLYTQMPSILLVSLIHLIEWENILTSPYSKVLSVCGYQCFPTVPKLDFAGALKLVEQWRLSVLPGGGASAWEVMQQVLVQFGDVELFLKHTAV